MEYKELDSESIDDILLGRCGLIIGTEATVGSHLLDSIADSLNLADLDKSKLRTSSQIGEFLRSRNLQTEDEIREEITNAYSQQKVSPYVAQLSKPNWAGILSLAPDNHLEDRIQVRFDRQPAKRPLTIVDDLTIEIPPRSVPSFKLNGMLAHGTATLFNEDRFRRRALWRNALSRFCDRVSGSAVVCIGVSADDEDFLTLVGEMLASSECRPASLVFLNGEPITSDSTLRKLLDGRIRSYQFHETLQVLVARIAHQEDSGRTALLALDTPDSETIVTRYSDIARVVKPLPNNAAKIPKVALLESLFSPSAPNWAAFAANLDFRRDIDVELSDEIAKALKDRDSKHNAILLTGSAANGKTITLKRSAYERGSSGDLVVWLTTTPVEAADRIFFELFRDIRLVYQDEKRILIYIDDPLRNRRGQVDIVIGNAAAAGFETTLVTSVRSSELDGLDEFLVIGRSTPCRQLVLEDQFSVEEVAKFPDYLVQIEAASSREIAERKMPTGDTVEAQDVLNILYLLVPNTRSVILASLRDEYSRILNIGSLKNIVAGTHRLGSEMIKKAYEMTAVANIYGLSLPLSVFRSATQFDWTDVNDVVASNSAVWGLIYPVETETEMELNARNDIVVEAVVNLVNGGRSNHTGEHRILQLLVNACKGKKAMVYRNFLAGILVGNKKLKRLSYEAGLELYESAINFLPSPDRVLLHHKGIWHADHHYASEAMKVFRQAVNTPYYPYTSGNESDANIFTSMAASLVGEIKAGKADVKIVGAEARELLEKASAEAAPTSHAVHVNASLAIELIRAIPEGNGTERLELATEAIEAIDQVELLSNSPVAHRHQSRKSDSLLAAARQSLYGQVMRGTEAEAEADLIWENSRHQDGFVIAARAKLTMLRQSGRLKGGTLASLYAYCEGCRKKVLDSNSRVDERLLMIQAEVFYSWRIYRAMLSPLEAEIEWQELLVLLGDLKLKDDDGRTVFFRFLKALALAHTGDWDGADGVFSQLRSENIRPDVLYLPRSFYLNAKGGKATLQGTIRKYGDKKYFQCELLQKTFLTERRDRWSEDTEIDHANILFSFAGPRVVHDS